MKLPSRLGVVHLALALFFFALIGKAVQVQLVHGREWEQRATRQQTREREIPAPRGMILDDSGRVMAQNQDKVRLDITPREVTQRAKLEQVLMSARVPAAVIARIRDTSIRNVTVPGVFRSVDVAGALGLKGVHVTPFVERTYFGSLAAKQIVGHVDVKGEPASGIELALDGLLRGKPGSQTMVQDVRRRTFASPTDPGIAPVEGSTIVLTIDMALQEIAEQALADAIARMEATSGDIVILDPHTGRVRAMASRRNNAQVTAAAVTEPFEPGSTLKPFVAAGLLQRGRITPADSIDTGDGKLEINKRVIHDDHPLGKVGLADIIRMSSNIGIVRFAERLTPAEQYETLRDFGFGTPTGIEFPSEAGGSLRIPKLWHPQSPASIAMGYEVAVTPLQLAVGYAAFANGGKILEPTLVKEVRSSDGEVRYRHEPRLVRQAISPEVAAEMRGMLTEVVRSGTATDAGIDAYVFAGKTGTPRGMVDGSYVRGLYNPNFVGLFPADDPQYVIAVRISNPSGAYYGGKTAAPVTRAVIEAAVASPQAALDRRRLAASVRAEPTPPMAEPVLRVASQPAEAAPESLPRPRPAPVEAAPIGPVVVSLPAVPPVAGPGDPRPVPDVRGMSLRDAVRTLHNAGFRVTYNGGGSARSASTTSPAAGSVVRPGSLVRLIP